MYIIVAHEITCDIIRNGPTTFETMQDYNGGIDRGASTPTMCNCNWVMLNAEALASGVDPRMGKEQIEA